MNKLLEISQTYSSISSQLGPSRSQAKIVFIRFLPKQFFSNNCTFSCNVSKACQVLQERSILLNPFPGPIMITSVITNFSVNKDIFLISKKTQFMHFALWVSRVLKYPKKCLEDNVFHVYLMREFQKYERNWILTMAFRATCKIAQPIQAIWLHIFALP